MQQCDWTYLCSKVPAAPFALQAHLVLEVPRELVSAPAEPEHNEQNEFPHVSVRRMVASAESKILRSGHSWIAAGAAVVDE